MTAGHGSGAHASPAWEPLSPTRLLVRSASIWAAEAAVTYRAEHITYAELLARVERTAGLLRSRGVRPGDRVATCLANRPEQLDLHFAVPGAGGVLVPINVRLGAQELAYILRHAEARLLVAASGMEALVVEAVRTAGTRCEVLYVGGSVHAEDGFAAARDAAERVALVPPEDETALISINYTSGTTGEPKGVMCTHRGAYLSALAHAGDSGLEKASTYLWTLPMFHCNGWTYPWAVTAVGARHVCLDRFVPAEVWSLLVEERVTHLCGAPALFSMLVESAAAHRLSAPVRAVVAGAPPSVALLGRLAELNLDPLHAYGLTETYGPVCASAPRRGSATLDPGARAVLRARQGAAMLTSEPLRVVDEQMRDVPRDGHTLGEVVMRGNTVSPGYYRDEAATARAFAGGWFHSGDLAVMHPDGDVELRDRRKDIVLFLGENISSIEVEHALEAHPAVVEAAVVGVPHERWGEIPKAFVALRAEAATPTVGELQAWVGGRLAPFKVPQEIVVRDALPRTATGKLQKAKLRAEFL